MRALLRQKDPETVVICRPMKSILKSTLAALTFAILSAFALSGCESSGARSANRTHEMGPSKSPYRMSDQSMPGR
jgi:hypothetical protein